MRITARVLLILGAGAGAYGLSGFTPSLAACVDSDYVQVRPSPASPASSSTITARFACYSILSGDWANCAFTYRVVGLAQPASDPGNSGGHVGHAGLRPLVLNDARNPGGAVLYAHDTDASPLGVRGFTMETPPFVDATVRHPTPEASGRLAVDTTITAPPGGVFCFFDSAGRTLLTHAIVDVGVPDLEPLAAVGNDHQVVRGGTETHPDGTSGTADSTNTLLRIAAEYRRISGSQLSVNDLSLPAGGLFDIGANWQAPHRSHRGGADADINRTNVSGETIDCSDDEDLARAVEHMAAGRAFPFLRCESGGRKHIDL